MELNLTDEQIAALLEQATATPDGGGGPPPKLKYRLGTQSFEAASPEELQAQLDTAMSHIGTTVQQLQTAATKPAPAAAQAPQFDKERYAKLFLEDPLQAQEYMDEIRFGVSRPADTLKTVIKDVGAMEQAMAVQQFMGSTDGYVATPENFNALSSYMSQYNLPWTAQGMKLAYGQARLDGKIQNEDDQPYAQPSQFAMNPRRGVPTVPRTAQVSSTSVDQDMISRFETLSPTQMKQFLENLGGG